MMYVYISTVIVVFSFFNHCRWMLLLVLDHFPFLRLSFLIMWWRSLIWNLVSRIVWWQLVLLLIWVFMMMLCLLLELGRRFTDYFLWRIWSSAMMSMMTSSMPLLLRINKLVSFVVIKFQLALEFFISVKSRGLRKWTIHSASSLRFQFLKMFLLCLLIFSLVC